MSNKKRGTAYDENKRTHEWRKRKRKKSTEIWRWGKETNKIMWKGKGKHNDQKKQESIWKTMKRKTD